MEGRLVANRIMTPDGTILQSFHRHDYKVYTDVNGLEYMVDGGLDYARRTIHKDHPYVELSVYDTDPHKAIREAFHWGTRGPSGNDELKWIPISAMTDNHIISILETQNHIKPWVRHIFTTELEYRKTHEG